MKKNRLFMLGLVTVFVAVLSLTLVSSTFARYTSTVAGQDSAKVAKWAFDYQSESIVLTQNEVAFDLFNTIKDSNGTDNETDVTTGRIAPGTSGSFALSFQNKSEVTANLNVAFDEVTASGVPLEFSFNSDFSDSVTDIAGLSWNQDLAIGSDAIAKTIYWRWVIDGNDTTDTNLGITAPDVTMKMTVVFTQVD